MEYHFTKMHGAGNDFIVVDDTSAERCYSPEFIRAVCHRRTGIGADGFFALRKLPDGQVRMDFFNCDGSKADLCGNGLRCAASFAYRNHLASGKNISFVTDSGTLHAEIIREDLVRIELPLTEDFAEFNDVCGFRGYKGIVGVPHFVVPVDDIESIDVETKGREIRYSPVFAPAGVNVDFVQRSGGGADSPLPVRTYERGVEGETLACGTGIASTAYALWKFCSGASKQSFLSRSKEIISVEISANGNIVKGIYLTGPAVVVFTGVYVCRK